MKEKKTSPIVCVHMGLTVVFAVINVVSTCVLFTSQIKLPFANILINCLNVFTVIFGIIYLTRGYKKDAAPYYKTFLLLTAATTVIHTYLVLRHTSSWLSVTLLFLKIIALAVLSFTEDMGKKTTFTVYYILLAIDLLYGFLFPPLYLNKFMQFTTIISRLLITGSIGLMIQGKYADKEARGRE